MKLLGFELSKAKPKGAAMSEVANDMGLAVDFVMSIPEIAEAFTRADIELALDDRGWLTPGRGWTSADLDNQTRTSLVAKSRLYWSRDPLAKQAVRIWTDYALGDGMTYSSDDEEVQDCLDAFCKDKRNRAIMDSEGQRRSSKKLLVDGELFFLLFDEDDDEKSIRRVDCLQVTDIICDPDDEERVLGYKRVTAQNKTLFYADWRCDDDDIALLEQQKDPATKSDIKAETGVVMYHMAFDTLLKRGNGLLFSAVDWTKEHRRFMEARVAITQALAKFAWKNKVKGGQQVLDNVIAKTQSTYATSGATQVERHPQNAPAATWYENAGMDLTPMPRSTGGSEASEDGNALKLMVCAATGVMLHYFGDPSTGNLATATAMELPMLKMFQSYQSMWTQATRDLFSIVLDDGDDDAEDEDDDTAIDIDYPPILADDLQKLGAFLQQAAGLFPELKVPEVLQILMQSLGVSNLNEVMEAVAAKREQIDANVKAGLNPDGSKPVVVNPGGNSNPNGSPTNPESQIGEAVRRLEESFNKMFELLEWPDNSGNDDHGRGGMAEIASTRDQHQDAHDYHMDQVNKAEQQIKKARGAKKEALMNQSRRHGDAARHHLEARGIRVSAELGSDGVTKEYADHASSWARGSSRLAHGKERGE